MDNKSFKIIWLTIKFILTVGALIVGWIVFQLIDLCTLRAISSFKEGLEASTGEHDPIDVVKWFRSLSLVKRLAVFFVIGSIIVLVLRGCADEGTEATTGRRSAGESETPELTRYNGIASDGIEISMLKGCNNNGAFGFSWGEFPKRKEYKVPCVVVYTMPNTEFPILEIMYGKDGLSMLSLKRSLGPTIKTPYGMSQQAQAEWKKSMVESSVPLIKNLREIAQQCTDQDVRWCVLGDSLVGCSSMGEGVHYFVGIRVDLPYKNNREQVLFVSHIK